MLLPAPKGCGGSEAGIRVLAPELEDRWLRKQAHVASNIVCHDELGDNVGIRDGTEDLTCCSQVCCSQVSITPSQLRCVSATLHAGGVSPAGIREAQHPQRPAVCVEAKTKGSRASGSAATCSFTARHQSFCVFGIGYRDRGGTKEVPDCMPGKAINAQGTGMQHQIPILAGEGAIGHC